MTTSATATTANIKNIKSSGDINLKTKLIVARLKRDTATIITSKATITMKNSSNPTTAATDILMTIRTAINSTSMTTATTIASTTAAATITTTAKATTTSSTTTSRPEA